MKMQSPCARSMSRAVFGFITLVGITTAVAVAKGMGFIESAGARRAIALLVGVMAVLIGNFVPKMRPLNSPSGSPAKDMAAERSAGWILVLAGISFIALFLFAPLEQASRVSSVVGISALVAIAANWTWLRRTALSRSRQITGPTAGLSEQAEERKVVTWLLFAFFYVFATACVVFLFHNKPWIHDFGSWIVLAFGLTYAVLYGVSESKPRC